VETRGVANARGGSCRKKRREAHRVRIRNWLIDYNEELTASQKQPAEDKHNWELRKPELSFEIWKLWKSFGEKFLPFPGSLLEQPDWWLHDMRLLNWLDRRIKLEM
jgi:hypothetical protein